MKKLLTGVMAALALGFAGNAYAFHDGGVAYCDGCHVMHNASSGTAKATAAANAAQGLAPVGQPQWSNSVNKYLLQGSDQSSTCLICHSAQPAGSYHVADLSPAALAAGGAPLNFTPGGDFGWLKKSTSWTLPRKGSHVGNRSGHNVVAADFNLTADTQLTAPGGSFTVAATGNNVMSCSSCHDPHGRYRIVSNNPVAFAGPSSIGNKILPIGSSGSYGVLPTATEAVGSYRLLGGAGYAPVSNSGYPFANPPPVAVAPATYNQSESTNEVRVAYGAGMSEWCQNCHTNIHTDTYVSGQTGAGTRHPAGNNTKLTAAVASIYNAYISSGDLTGTNEYTSLVPFETGVKDLAGLAAVATFTAPLGSAGTGILVASNSANVMCLSCHRAHATGFDSMVRWNPSAEFLSFDVYPGTNQTGEASYGSYAIGRTSLENQAAYYQRPIGAGGIGEFQRSLCNKCHAKD
jgi:hypothetical protein